MDFQKFYEWWDNKAPKRALACGALGVFSIIILWFNSLIGLAGGIAGLVVSYVARKHGEKNIIRTVGFILSLISVIIYVLAIVGIIGLFVSEG